MSLEFTSATENLGPSGDDAVRPFAVESDRSRLHHCNLHPPLILWSHNDAIPLHGTSSISVSAPTVTSGHSLDLLSPGQDHEYLSDIHILISRNCAHPLPPGFGWYAYSSWNQSTPRSSRFRLRFENPDLQFLSRVSRRPVLEWEIRLLREDPIA